MADQFCTFAPVGDTQLARSTRSERRVVKHEPPLANGSIGNKLLTPAITIRLGRRSDYIAEDIIRRRTDVWMTPFQTAGWRGAWDQHVGCVRNVQPVSAIVSDGARSVAILPLAIHEAVGLRYLTWHAHDQGDYGAPIVRSAQLEYFSKLDGRDLLLRIANQVEGIDLVYLPKQPRSIADAVNPLVLPSSVEHHVGAHAINFTHGENWDEFLQRRRGAPTRQHLRRKQRALEKLGKVSFRLARTPSEARNIVAHCLKSKSEQLAKLGHWDPFAAIEIRTFLEHLVCSSIGGTSWAAALTLDDEPVATAFGFSSPSEWLLYQMSMSDARGAECSPGTQLLMNLMRHCTETGVLRLDLSLGDETYKLEWCDEHETLLTTSLPLTLSGTAAHALIKARAGLRKWFSSNPRLYHAGKTLKQKLRRASISV